MKDNIKKISLNGMWNFITDPEDKLDFESVIKKFSTEKLPIMRIPSNWQLSGLDNYNGSVWFYKSFIFDKHNHDLQLLEFNGVDYFCDVWLNEKYIGHHEGYFQRFYFDISDFVSEKRENDLVVKVNSPFEKPKTVWPNRKKLIKGIFNHHDCRPGGWDLQRGQDKNTGGIWNDVNLISAQNVFVTNFRINTKLNRNYSKAIVTFTAEYISKLTAPLKDKLTIYLKDAVDFSKKNSVERKEHNNYVKKIDKVIELSKKSSSFSFSFEINNPKLWWSWDIGSPYLYEINIEGEKINKISTLLGIREVKLDENKIFYLNRKKLFLRGTNIIPTQFLSELNPKKISRQIKFVKEANINTLRVHAHVNRKEFYDECDKEGILVWQDFALQWTYDESQNFADNAACQIKDMVKLHYNHPSIAFWCCHNEPGEQIKSLDPILYNAVLRIDKSRIVRLASNYEEHPYDGWYWGNKEHFAACPMGPLVTEFGAQAIPDFSTLRRFLPEEEIEKPDWQKWKYHNFQYEQTFHIAKIERGNSIKEFISNSQTYQANLIKTAIDFYRREKFQKVNVLFQFMFIDCWPSITWSVIDYYEKKKKGYFALQQAFQPLYVSVKVMRDTYFPGQKLLLDIWIINDFHQSFFNCKLRLLLNGKMIGEMEIDKIDENSVKHFSWEKNEFTLPKKIKKGVYKIDVLLLNSSKKLISKNDFSISIEEKIDN
ncbi:glycoside hydrolase family 2 protein [Melioribacteraceae bacterium 4301-Me]|uniref:glycoside hydrolase family 2 protein n=1 Tax=Pyranulibacter aquaticus TaxID=3163344 RepID=UPI0035976F86